MAQKPITIAFNALPTDFNPQTMMDIYSMSANLQLHRGLLKFNENLEIENDIAESYLIKNNGKKIIFKISKNAFFSDGSKIVADDIVKTFQSLFKYKTAISSDLSYIKGADSAVKNISKLEVIKINDKEVLFNLKHASSLFLKQIATVDCSIIKVNSKLKIDHSIFSGPYSLQFKSNKKVILSLNDKNKFNKAPTEIIYVAKNNLVLDANSINNSIDTVDGILLSEETISQLKNKAWFDVISSTANIFAFVLNNKKVSNMDQKRIFNYYYFNKSFIDVKKFIPAYTVVPPAINGSNLKPIVVKSNIVKNKKTTNYNLLVIKDSPGLNMIKASLNDFYDATNIKLNVNELETAEYLKKVKKSNF